MEKTRATHDRRSAASCIRALIWKNPKYGCGRKLGATGHRRLWQRPEEGRGPGGYLTSAKVKAASNLVRRENLKLKRENKEMRQELKVADSKVRRLWTRLHRVEGGSLKGVSLAPEEQ